MRIHQLSVKDFRVHRDTKIKFDPRLTLVVGPNEAGKSTLMQAGHRALFLKASYNGSLREDMLPRPGGGTPEVELVFETQGTTWTLKKVFSGGSGYVTLTPEGKAPLQGDAADQRLAELIGGEEAVSGKGVSTQLPSRWNHLWVTQGLGGDSPAQPLAERSASLAALLSGQGAASVVMSMLDKKVMARIEREWAEVYTRTGKLAARGVTRERIENHEKAEVLFAEAERRVTELAGYCRAVEEATDFLSSAQPRKSELKAKLEGVGRRAGELQQLQQKWENDQEQRVLADKHLQTLLEREEGIRTQRAKLSEVKAELEPLRLEMNTATDDLAQAKADVKRQREAVEVRRTRAGEARVAVNRARSMVGLLDALARKNAFARESAQIDELRSDLQNRQSALATLPQVDEETLKELDALDRRLQEAATILEATAASIEVARASTEVRVNGELLSEGDTRNLTEVGEIEIGEFALLRIRPGGGRRLSEAREDLATAQSALAEAVVAVGAASLEHARSAYTAGLEHRVRIEALERDLKQRGFETLDQRLREVEAAVAEARRDFRARGGDPDSALPDAAEARAKLLHAEETQGIADEAEESERKALTEAEGREASLEHGHIQRLEKLRNLERDLQLIDARLADAVGHAGSDEARQSEIQLAKVAADEARKAEEESSSSVGALDPEQIEQDRLRLERSLEDLERNIEERGDARNQALGALRARGEEDPYAQLDLARAAVEDAKRRRESAEQDARAIDLLQKGFERARAELGQALSGPLRERVDPYVKAIFGPNAKASIEIDGMNLEKLALLRSEEFAFDELSAGAREQFGAAFRLATAEAFAQPFGGTLPIFLDDTFANSDDQRIEGISRALFLAAERGLQVVLFTCRPEAWTELGARTVSLGEG